MLRRAPRRTQFQRSRALHLVHNLFTDNSDISATELATVREKEYPRAEEISLKLIDRESHEVATMTLSQALQRLKPLSYLAEAGAGAYCIRTFPNLVPLKPIKSEPKSYKPWTRAGRGKEAHLTTSCTPQSLRHTLSTSYKYILEGTRMEFHLHQKSKDKDKRTVDWALANCMHLRPDSILAAMPEGTTMLGEPATTDLSFKTKPSKNHEKAKTRVVWIVENKKVLQLVGVHTPERVQKLARWPRNSI